ncbi:hypothetical protein [Parafrankia sp. EUN1f]|uniref:hypothetical protein n=1 Tax=Parafrankia sp. EUN1f TaxID=102897 RepID=UPI00055A8CDF|nr:hypothetical protein [Parafrankia sp. EUN1f]
MGWLVVTRDAGAARALVEVGVFGWSDLSPASAGTRVAEAHQVLVGVQQQVLVGQVDSACVDQARCPACARAHRYKNSRTIVPRTLFDIPHAARLPLMARPPHRADGPVYRRTPGQRGHQETRSSRPAAVRDIPRHPCRPGGRHPRP